MVRRLSSACAAALAIAVAAPALAQSAPDWNRAGGSLFAGVSLDGASPAEAGPTPPQPPADGGEVAAFVPVLSTPEQPYAAAIDEAAGRHGLDPRLLHALVVVESAYRPRAESHAGAAGLTQLMPATAAELGVVDRLDPGDNLRGGAAYLARQVVRFGDLRLALAAYNAGPHRVARLGRIPPIAETQAYVTAVVDCYLALAAGRSVRSARECPTDRSVR